MRTTNVLDCPVSASAYRLRRSVLFSALVKAGARRLRLALALSGLVLAGACRQPLTAEQKLNAWVTHQRKMETVLEDVQMDCDSSMAATLRYRLDSLQTALAKPVSAPAHPAHHAHPQPNHHHHRAHPQ